MFARERVDAVTRIDCVDKCAEQKRGELGEASPLRNVHWCACRGSGRIPRAGAAGPGVGLRGFRVQGARFGYDRVQGLRFRV